MFGSLVRQARATIETSISEVVDRAIVAVPFLVAAGFFTTALAAWLIRSYGLEMGALIVGALFVVLGLIMYASMGAKREAVQPEQLSSEASGRHTNADAEADRAWSETETDLVKAAIAASAPHALPVLMRLIVRNLPLIASVLAVLFVMTRSVQRSEQADARPTPAE